MKNKEKKYINISIPIHLNKKIQKKIENTDFHSVESYVEHILEKSVSTNKEKTSKEAVFTKEEEDEVKNRLKGLGYLE